MLPYTRFVLPARVVLLPLGLALAVVAGLGSYCETSDDQTLAWLFAGVLALKPVASLPLYFHGYGHALAAGYAAAPAVPWLGLLLGALLAGATGLFFAVLDKLLRPYLKPVVLTAVLVVYFGLAWLEHWLWFSHVRVAVLLAGAAVLFAAQRPERRVAWLLGLAGVGAAWLLRPSAAVLGVGAVLPAAVLLAGGWRRAAPLLLGVAAALALATGVLAGQRTPAEVGYQARDRYLTQILDDGQLRSAPQTPADSLGIAAVGAWLLGDSAVVNEAFFRRAYRFAAADFWGREVPAKLRLRAGLLLRDYFPVLLALAAAGWGAGRPRRRRAGFWLVQGGFVAGLAGLAGLLKLPPRLELPLLDFWLLTNLIFWLKNVSQEPESNRKPAPKAADLLPVSAVGRALSLAAVLLVSGLYGAKTWHRQQVLRTEQRRHERALRAIGQLGARRVRILAGTNDYLKSLSPFRTYAPGPGPVLLLTGWPAHDPSQPQLRRALSGAADQSECLRRLAGLPPTGAGAEVRWVLTPETAAWLSRRWGFDGLRLRFAPTGALLPLCNDSPVSVFQVRPVPAPEVKSGPRAP